MEAAESAATPDLDVDAEADADADADADEDITITAQKAHPRKVYLQT